MLEFGGFHEKDPAEQVLRHEKTDHTPPRQTLRSIEIRCVSIPLKRPVVSKVGLFDRWPLVLIDLHTKEGIAGRSYLEPYLERLLRYLVAICELAEARNDRSCLS